MITPEFYGHEALPAVPADMELAGDSDLVNLVVLTHDKASSFIPRSENQNLKLEAKTRINGVDYKIYSDLPQDKHIVNNKLFKLQQPSH